MESQTNQLGLGLIGWREVKDLTAHPATALIPAAPKRDGASQPTDSAPLHILADGQILVGRDRYERARADGQAHLATVVVTVPKEQIELYVLDQASASHFLTDDQRTCLAVEYADRLSARMRRERAQNAAAVRYGRDALWPPGAGKQDARADACERFRVAANRFRQARKLRSADREFYQQVLLGRSSLKAARDAVIRKDVEQAEVLRSLAAPRSDTPSLILGDALEVIPTLPRDHFTALITDPPYGVGFRQEWRGAAEIEVIGDADADQSLALFRGVLEAASPVLRRDAFLITFVPAKFEPEFRAVVALQGWRIIAYPIWVKNTRVLFPHLNVASQHERMLLAIRGQAKLRRPLADVFRHGKSHRSSHPCEKPLGLMSALIEATTVEGEAILDPFAGSGSTVLAARRLRRRVTGIEISERWFDEAQERHRGDIDFAGIS